MVCKKKWKILCLLWGLNSRPSDYETDALPTVPRRLAQMFHFFWCSNTIAYHHKLCLLVLMNINSTLKSLKSEHFYTKNNSHMADVSTSCSLLSSWNIWLEFYYYYYVYSSICNIRYYFIVWWKGRKIKTA